MLLGLLLGILMTIASKPGRRHSSRRDDSGYVLIDDDDDPNGLGPGYSWQDVGAAEEKADSFEPGGGGFGGGGASGDWGGGEGGDGGGD